MSAGERNKRKTPRPTAALNPPTELIEALMALAPALDDPRCARHPHPEWWDATVDAESPDEQRERHTLAAGLCALCACREQCRAVAEQSQHMSATLRLSGVWGGTIFPPTRDGRQVSDEQRAEQSERVRKGWCTRRARAAS